MNNVAYPYLETPGWVTFETNHYWLWWKDPTDVPSDPKNRRWTMARRTRVPHSKSIYARCLTHMRRYQLRSCLVRDEVRYLPHSSFRKASHIHPWDHHPDLAQDRRRAFTHAPPRHLSSQLSWRYRSTTNATTNFEIRWESFKTKISKRVHPMRDVEASTKQMWSSSFYHILNITDAK